MLATRLGDRRDGLWAALLRDVHPRALPGTLKNVARDPDEYRNLQLKVGVIYGADSELFTRRTLDYMRELIPQGFPAVAVEHAQHHVFLDQPLAFVDALRGLLKDLGC